ncbi:hypothetical protein [Mycolicibacterium bacteremicum]|uniref:hypothetical protein n=1 Tax=Mycolicibacterium bacteremicum TaxID=564198 RepID=UPI0026F2EDC6|nr:hypothetical protein [Mycolicibacterium bacteremicum]
MTARRRQLLVLSAPVVLILLLVAGWSVWSGLTDRAATQRFAEGLAAARDDRLLDAEEDFDAVLQRVEGGRSCALRVDLVLVRETLGDRAVAAADADEARGYYRSARDVVAQAPPGCFADNTDADAGRREIRAQAAPRLDAKLATLSQPLPPAPPLAPPPPPPPAGSPAPGGAPTPDERERRLNPDQGDPLDRLGDILRDAAGR